MKHGVDLREQMQQQKWLRDIDSQLQKTPCPGAPITLETKEETYRRKVAT